MSSGMTAMMIAGTVMQGMGQKSAGDAAAAQGAAEQTASDYTAGLLQQQAGQVRATTQAGIEAGNTKTAYLESTVRARAAASGGGATDPTVIAGEGQIAARGQYDALSMLYTGEEKARGLETQAALKTYEGQEQLVAGKVKQQTAYRQAIGSVLSSGASIYSKYGMGSAASSTGGGYGVGGNTDYFSGMTA